MPKLLEASPGTSEWFARKAGNPNPGGAEYNLARLAPAAVGLAKVGGTGLLNRLEQVPKAASWGPRAQGGAINLNRVKATSAQVKSGQAPSEALFEAFEGAFNPRSMAEARAESLDPRSRERLVWMSPDEFHAAALSRDGSYLNSAGVEARRDPIREALLTSPEGLRDIPQLHTDKGSVWGHEGRHRSDIFKELGVEKIPVRLRDSMFRNWAGDFSEALPTLLSENGAVIPTPKPIFRGPSASQRGVIAWHGSPYQFDKFDSRNIGRGEGAQAYGHGLYLAESPKVAQQYQETGAAFRNSTALHQMLQGAGYEVPVDVADALALGLGRQNARPPAEVLAAKRRQFQGSNWPYLSRAVPEIDRLMQDEALLQKLGQKGQSYLYKVDFPDEAAARTLDWDKPLKQQAPGISDALRGLAKDPTTRKMLGEDTRASAAYKLLGLDLSSADEAYQGSREVAAALQKLGIPGIRYLDQASRGAGAGTSNYVVFPGEEPLLKILERNGKPLGLGK